MALGEQWARKIELLEERIKHVELMVDDNPWPDDEKASHYIVRSVSWICVTVVVVVWLVRCAS